MSLLWSKSRTGRVLEGSAHLLDGAIGFGFVGAAAVAAAFGRLLLAVLLGSLAFAVFLRMTRRKRALRSGRQSNAAKGENEI